MIITEWKYQYFTSQEFKVSHIQGVLAPMQTVFIPSSLEAVHKQLPKK